MKSRKIAFLVSLLVVATGCNDEGVETSCVEHTDCAEDEMCRSDRCYPVYGEAYVIHIVSAAYIPVTDPNGDFWDPVGEESGTEPDPYATFYDLDGGLCTTPHVEDFAAPTWGHRCASPFTVEEDSRYGWSLYEDDDGPDDFKIAGTPEGEEFQILVEWIREGVFSQQEGRPSLTFSIEPR